MNPRVLFAVPLAALVACSGTDTTTPSVPQQTPQLAISDGAHAAGNADFFFLPPVVLPTGPLTNWTRGGFNRNLSPSVEICPLNVTTAAAVTPTTPCKTMAGFPVVISGPAVKKHFPPTADPDDALSGLPDDWAHYHAQWKVPNPCNIVYRVTVKVGAVTLGFADVQCVTNIFGLLTIDYKKFGPALRGLNLQIPFRIEQFALCAVPGIGPCSTTEITTATGGTANYTPPGGTEPDGVIIPPQPPAPPGQPPLPPDVALTVSSCPALNPRATDLPVFGDCIRVTSNPALPPAGLTAAATVLLCNLHINIAAEVFSHEQEHRITMHRLDEDPNTHVQTLTALPHVVGCAVHESDADGSIKGMLAALSHGRVKAAAGQVLAMLGPQSLYARRLNQGGGALTKGFSDFGYALPTKMTIQSGDGQVAPPGSTLPNNPTVLLTDLVGEPVAGGRVTFAPTVDGTATPIVVVTGADGLASTQWKLKSSAGPNTLVASGRGIGGTDFNGPRPGLDPFQPIQSAFDVGGPLGPVASEVTVLNGSQTFSAGGADAPIPVPFRSAGYNYLIIDPTAAPPAGWETTGFVPTGWSSGGSPFGSGDQSNCGYNPVTTWGLNTDILVRKSFTLGSAHNVIIRVAIDNDVEEVFLNGQALNDGAFVHEGCANPAGDATYFGNAQAGTNVIAIHSRDRGGSSYFDVQVELNDPCSDCVSGSAVMNSSITLADLVVGPTPVSTPTVVRVRRANH